MGKDIIEIQDPNDRLLLHKTIMAIDKDYNSTVTQVGRCKRKWITYQCKDIKTNEWVDKEGWSLGYDAIEDTEEYKKVIDSVEEEIKKELGDDLPFGSAWKYWSTKKRILMDKYGIDWLAPVEITPWCRFG